MENLNRNSLSYKILAQGEFREDEVTAFLTSKKPISNDIVEKAVEQQWLDLVKGRKSVGKDTWNSEIFALRSFNPVHNQLTLNMGVTSFKYLQGTNATYWLLGDIYGKDCLANGALVQSLVFDKDGNCVFGKRNTGVKKEYEPFVIFGGTMDKQTKLGEEIPDGHNPFTAMHLELEEELGLDKSNIQDIYISSI